VADIFRPFVAGWNRAHAVWTRARQASGSFDHAVRAWLRFDETRADRMAAYMSYLGVLSLFPILGLAFAVAALLVANVPAVGREFDDLINSGLQALLPGLGSASTDVFGNLQSGASKRLGLTTGGVVTAAVGVGVLLYTGSGWIGAQREALRTVFGSGPRYDRFFLIAKAFDILVLLGLGTLLILSVAASTLAQFLSGQVLEVMGMRAGSVDQVLIRIAAVLAGIITGVALFLLQHHTLAGVPDRRWRDYLSGAVLAAIGFELLKQAAALLIGRVTNNPIYGTFAAIIAILIWINLTSRVTLLGAAWTYTGWVHPTAAEQATRAVATTAPGPPVAETTVAASTVVPTRVVPSLVARPAVAGPAVAGPASPGPTRIPGGTHVPGATRIPGGTQVADGAHIPDGGGNATPPRPVVPAGAVASVLSVGLAVAATAAALTGLRRRGPGRR